MIKVALIGAGGIAGVHSYAYESVTDAKVTAVVDIREENARKLAEKHGAKSYGSIEEMLEHDKPDMVDLCVPTYLHAPLAVKAMEAGIHVLCEKPVSLNLESARKMKDTAARNKVLFMAAHVIRFWPEYMYLKKVYDEKTYGRLLQASFSREGAMPLCCSWENWFLQKEKSGRVPVDLHIHDADYIMYLLGLPKAVSSRSIEQGNDISCISTQYIYDDRVVVAEGGWYGAPLPFSMGFRAIFEKAVLIFRDYKLMLYTEGNEPRQISFNEEKSAEAGINITSTNGYFNEIRYFIDCIKNNTQPTVITPQETLDCLDMIMKEIKSANTGKVVLI